MSDVNTSPSLADQTDSGGRFFRNVALALGGFTALVVVAFVGLLAIAAFNPEQAAAIVRYVRDVLISILCLQSIIIVMALGILIVQIARFVNLLRNETKPVTDQARETLTTVRTSTVFVSKAAAEPLIALRSWFAGLVVFFKLVVSLQALRALMRKPERPDDEAPTG